jgi:hypothetical protein
MSDDTINQSALAGGGQSISVEDMSKLSVADSKLSLSSQTIHADDFLNSRQDVAPPLHVSTTYRYTNDPSQLKPVNLMAVCCLRT